VFACVAEPDLGMLGLVATADAAAAAAAYYRAAISGSASNFPL